MEKNPEWQWDNTHCPSVWPPPSFRSAGCQGNLSFHRVFPFSWQICPVWLLNVFLLAHLCGLPALCSSWLSHGFLLWCLMEEHCSPYLHLPSYFSPAFMPTILTNILYLLLTTHFLQSLSLSCSDISNLLLWWPCCCIWFSLLFFFWDPLLTPTNLCPLLWVVVFSFSNSFSRSSFTLALHSKQVALPPAWSRELHQVWPSSTTSCCWLSVQSHPSSFLSLCPRG